MDALNLIDTGAQVSVIPKHLYDSLPDKKRPPLKPSKIHIRAGNESRIGFYGVANLDFEIQGMKFNYDVHVVDDSVGPILGYDFLRDTGDSHISPSEHSVTIRGKKLKLSDPTESRVSHKVNIKQTIVIGPREEINTEASVRGRSDINGRVTVMEPSRLLFSKTGALLCKLAVIPSKNTIPVRVFNPHDEPIRIYKGTTLGILTEADETRGWRDPREIEDKQQSDTDDMPGLVDMDAPDAKASKKTKVKASANKKNQQAQDPDVFIMQEIDGDDPRARRYVEQRNKVRMESRLSEDRQAAEGYDADEQTTDDEDAQHSTREQVSYPNIRAFAKLPTKADGSIDDAQLPAHMQKLYEASIGELNAIQQTSLRKLLCDYSDIFARDANDIGRAKNIQHHIDTGSENPVSQRPRRQAKTHTDEIQRQVKKLHDAGIIRPSESEWASNVVMVRKKDGQWRMCVDYRELNTKTKNKGTYMLPRIDDTLDSLSRAKYFCSLDIIQGYHHVELSEESKQKTAFHAPKCNPAHWEYNFMPFGLVGAPRTFQRMMDRILRGLEYKIALAYLDDIIIYGATIEECLANMKIVFERIRNAGLKLKPSKCSLFQRETTFLGHVISADGIKTDPKKVQDVVNMLPCRNVKDVLTFMGMTTYYSKFVPKFQEISRPIQGLTKKNVKFSWGSEQQRAFEKMKKMLITAPVLAYPRDDCKFILDTDASNYALGAVLSQLQPDENGNLVERPIAYYSKRFNGAELHYCARRRELLAIVKSVKHFNPYVRGQKFIIRTDHASLKYIKTMKELPSQFHRWVFALEEYSYEIEVRKGVLHANADGMSRMPCRMKRCICEGVQEMEKAGDCEDVNVAQIQINVLEYRPKYTSIEMAAAQRADPDIGVLYKAKVDDNKRPSWNEISGESPAAKAYIMEWRRIEVHDNILHRRWENDDGSEIRLQVLVPFKYQREICHNYHDTATKSHLGKRRCYAALQKRYFWHKMHDDIKWWIRTCDVCQRRKRPQPTPKAPMKIYVTGHPGERISMDIVGPIEPTERGNKYLLCITDHFSKFAKAIPLREHTAKTVAEELTTKWFEEYGEPMQVHTDHGPEFESRLMKELLKLLGVEKCRTVAFKPSSDGLVERYNKTIVDCIAMVRSETHHWDLVCGKCVSAYNATIHATTGFTPNKLWLGREIYHAPDLMLPRKPVDDAPTQEEYVKRWEDDMRLAYQVARKAIGRNVKIQKKYYDRASNLIEYREGDRVMIKDYTPKVRGEKKLADKWMGPFYVLDVLSDVSFRIIKDRSGKPKVIHHDRMKKYHSREEEPDNKWVLERSRSYSASEAERAEKSTKPAAVRKARSDAGRAKSAAGRQKQSKKGSLKPSNADDAQTPLQRDGSEVIKKGTGRKTKTTRTTEVQPPEIKKKRGRPPKNPAPVEPVPKRKRGRPPKNKV